MIVPKLSYVISSSTFPWLSATTRAEPRWSVSSQAVSPALPISTITWSFDVLCDRFSGAGWHLIQVEAEAVGDGYSSQRMTLWDTTGTAVLVARQTIAIFG